MLEATTLAPKSEKSTSGLPAKTAEPFQLDLPVPPSVNLITQPDYRGVRRYLSPWRKLADGLLFAARYRSRKVERFALHITLSEAHTTVDLDNPIKPLIDYLRKIEAIANDDQKRLRRLVVEWGEAPEGCRVVVVPLNDR